MEESEYLEAIGEELPPQQARYIVRNAAFALQPQPPVEWIVEKLISAASVSIFYGEPGSKKTYSLLSLAVCVALGKPWLDYDTIKGKVLIVDEESGERRLTARLGMAIRGELGGEDTPIEFVSLAQFKLDDPNDVTILQSLIEETGAGLVIIDALADVMDGDENSKQDTQPVFSTLRRIAERTGAAIIIIHHSNKNGGYRGSSAIKGAVDLMVLIESENGSRWINFRSEKVRDGESQSWGAVATWSEDQFYLSVAEAKEKKKVYNKSQRFVISYLREHGATALPAIMAAADTCSANAARQAVYTLAEAGMVYRTNRDASGRGVEAIYDLRNAAGVTDETGEE